jgi:putative ABC transport system permease protein
MGGTSPPTHAEGLRMWPTTDVLPTLRQAARALRRSPTYAIASVLTLTLGIGANLVIFSVASAVLLRPLPYAAPASLYWLAATHTDPTGETFDYPIGPGEYLRWKAGTRTLQHLDVLTTQQLALTGDGDPETVTGGLVSAGLFATLGIHPQRGRLFAPAEDAPRSGVVIVSHEFWRRRLAGSADAVGQTLVLNGEPRVVVAIMPPRFRPLLQPSDLWIPLGVDEAAVQQQPGARYLLAVGRARPGVTRAQIDADLAPLSAQLARDLPATHTGWSGKATPLREQLSSAERKPVVALLVLVDFLLLLACANVANLTLARAAARRGESALRVALGAGAWQIVQVPLAESLLLAAAGGAGGLLVAVAAVGPLAALDPAALPMLHTVRVDGRVLAFAAGVTVLAGVLCAIVPGLYVLRSAPAGLLAEGGRRATGSTRDRRTRRLLMAAQIAFALVLVAGAASMIRLLALLGRAPLGFDPSGVTVAALTLPESRYATNAARAAFAEELARRVRALPGVTAASATSNRFLVNASRQTSLVVEGRPAAPGEAVTAHYRRVVSDYFTAMRIPIRGGRAIGDADRADAAGVAVVSRSFAAQYWPNEDPLGKRIKRTAPGTSWLTVVGVAEDVRDWGVGNAPEPTIYVPYAQSAIQFVTLVVRTATPAVSLERPLREAVRGLDPLLPIDEMGPLERYLSDSLAAERFRTLLLTLFAALGLLLAAVGIYAVTAYLLAERTREVGVRMALGAGAADVLRLLVLESVRWVGLGVALGLVVTTVLATVARATVDDLVQVDVASSAAVALVVSVMAMVATAVPTLRATRTSPAVALRGEG